MVSQTAEGGQHRVNLIIYVPILADAGKAGRKVVEMTYEGATLVVQEQCQRWYEQAVVACSRAGDLEPDDVWFDHKYTRMLAVVQVARGRVETRWEAAGCRDRFISNLVTLLGDMETDMVEQYVGLLR